MSVLPFKHIQVCIIEPDILQIKREHGQRYVADHEHFQCDGGVSGAGAGFRYVHTNEAPCRALVRMPGWYPHLGGCRKTIPIICTHGWRKQFVKKVSKSHSIGPRSSELLWIQTIEHCFRGLENRSSNFCAVCTSQAL